MTFSIVDRITEIEPGTRARGHFTVPQDAPHLSPWLVAEAVGQLAAWAAMAKMDFRIRPVAGITGEVKIFQTVVPTARLNLEANLESCESDAVLYGGRGHVGGDPIIELNRCVGPMLPMEDFDDPDVVRHYFELLCGEGAPFPGFSSDGIPSPEVTLIDHDPGKRTRAEMRIPESAQLFADHFPRKPIFPGTLLLHAQVQLALRIALEAIDPSKSTLLRPTRISNVKLRSFVDPGTALEMSAEVIATSPDSVTLALGAEAGGQRVSTARMETGLGGHRD